MANTSGQIRVIVESVKPEIGGGRFPIKRVAGDKVVVEADIFTDGHDVVRGALLYRRNGEQEWRRTPLRALVNDRWWGEFTVSELGRYFYTVEGWVDAFASWRRDLDKRILAATDTTVDYLVGALHIEAAAGRASGDDTGRLEQWAAALRRTKDVAELRAVMDNEELTELALKYPDPERILRYDRELAVTVDRERARFSAWYEFFPRSTSPEPGKHGTLADATRHLDYVASMGFDVVYLPPIHPIGRRHRKGKNNTPQAAAGDVGSPWAIGSEEGGHKAIHPELGTLEDFRALVARARELQMEIALDIAFQCAPDHPYVREHPDWFRWRPDGTVQYAENPPKKYQDIYPFEFETDQWQEMWEELKSVFEFWIENGVRIFRVDNPHTKSLRFWQWTIAKLKEKSPDTIFLAEAFTRPKVMYELAKMGFSQSYNYFPWRNTAHELREYFTELTRTEVSEYFRPNLWPNTPDILTEYLQYGGRPAFAARLLLAGTLGASYGIYGGAFELAEGRAKEFGSEEYLDSEKYQLRQWDLKRPDSLKPLIARINGIRRKNAALHSDSSLRFHEIENDQLICYSKRTADLSNMVVVVVNLDPHHRQSGWVNLRLAELGLDPDRPFQVHDVLSESRFLWQGPRNYIEIDPQSTPGHIFVIRRKTKTERDFDYYM